MCRELSYRRVDDRVGHRGGVITEEPAPMRITTLNRPATNESPKSPLSTRSALQAAERELSGVRAVIKSAIANLEVSNQNVTASDSHLTDTEMPPELVTFTADQLLLRAGAAMPVDAASETILELLQ